MSRTPRTEDSTRQGRTPVAAQRSKLSYKGLDTKNFYHRWVIDRDDRISMFVEAGYEFVAPHNKSVGEAHVDQATQAAQGSRVTKPAGYGGFKLYLMRLPLKFWEADQKLKQAEIDEIELSMRHPGKGKAVGPDIDYGKISMIRKNTPATADSDE